MGSSSISTQASTENMAPKVAASRIPNLRTIFPMKGMKRNMGSVVTSAIRPEIWAFLKYAWNMTETAAEAPAMAMYMAQLPMVAPMAGRFLQKFLTATKMLNLGASSPHRASTSTRITVVRIRNWKATKPRTPITRATAQMDWPLTRLLES